VRENGLGLDKGLGFSCTESPGFFDLPGFFLDYRPRARPRSINKTRSPGTGPGFSKIPIYKILPIKPTLIRTKSPQYLPKTVAASKNPNPSPFNKQNWKPYNVHHSAQNIQTNRQQELHNFGLKNLWRPSKGLDVGNQWWEQCHWLHFGPHFLQQQQNNSKKLTKVEPKNSKKTLISRIFIECQARLSPS